MSFSSLCANAFKHHCHGPGVQRNQFCRIAVPAVEFEGDRCRIHIARDGDANHLLRAETFESLLWLSIDQHSAAYTPHGIHHLKNYA